MTFVDEYLNADERKKYTLLRSYLQGIKHESYEDCIGYFGKFDFDKITSENLIDLVRLSVHIEHAFSKRFKKIPAWCTDKRLLLERPYKGRGYNETWFFFGAQACLRHNFFIDPGALEVM
jgi:hypothetical protein